MCIRDRTRPVGDCRPGKAALVVAAPQTNPPKALGVGVPVGVEVGVEVPGRLVDVEVLVGNTCTTVTGPEAEGARFFPQANGNNAAALISINTAKLIFFFITAAFLMD